MPIANLTSRTMVDQSFHNISRANSEGKRLWGRAAAVAWLMKQNGYNRATALRVMALEAQLWAACVAGE